MEIGEENAGRHLLEHEEDHHHSHNHNHSHSHDEPHDLNGEMDQALSHIKDNLRGSNIRFEKRRRLVRGNYNCQVDLYIEVDQTLVNDNGGGAQLQYCQLCQFNCHGCQNYF